MKLQDILCEATSALRQPISVETETGTATYDPSTGEMTLDNSGYVQTLTSAQVAAAWSGANILPFSPQQMQDLQQDLSGAELKQAIKRGLAQFQPEWGLWNFGDEQHYIPQQAELEDAAQGY